MQIDISFLREIQILEISIELVLTVIHRKMS